VVAPELTASPTGRIARRRLAPGIAAAWLYAYGAIWTVTLAAAAVVALVGRPLASSTRQLLGLTLTPRRNPPPHLFHVLALAAHNVPIAAWPLLLGLTGADRRLLARCAADSLVVACLLANTVPVGAALGAYGTAVVAYIPQLPLEFAGLALGYGGWIVQRQRPLTACERLVWLAVIVAVLLVAGALETAVAPHR